MVYTKTPCSVTTFPHFSSIYLCNTVAPSPALQTSKYNFGVPLLCLLRAILVLSPD